MRPRVGAGRSPRHVPAVLSTRPHLEQLLDRVPGVRRQPPRQPLTKLALEAHSQLVERHAAVSVGVDLPEEINVASM